MPSGGHSFSAPELFAAVMIAPEDSGKIANGRIEIPAGQAVDVHLTPMTAGTYQIVCTHFLHQTFGMRGLGNYRIAPDRRAATLDASRGCRNRSTVRWA
jgi:hypothetical protein